MSAIERAEREAREHDRCQAARGSLQRAVVRFCSVTGLAGRYKCPVTGDYLSSLSAYETHRETRLVGRI